MTLSYASAMTRRGRRYIGAFRAVSPQSDLLQKSVTQVIMRQWNDLTHDSGERLYQ